ncbi:hypothetical protein BT69DRAFT_1025620 [Atractiella rhizophila]|nr:hypothetical protein BT69DRAFT_1025620 [Atractiella rhizophila]
MLSCLSASIVLMVENLHRLSSNQNVTPESLDVNRSESLDSFIWFKRVENVSTIAKVAVDVLGKLLDEEERRRAQRGWGIIETLRLANGESMMDLKYEARSLREVVEAIYNAPMPHYLTNSVPFTPPGGHQTLSHHSHSQSPQSPDRVAYGSIPGQHPPHQHSSPPYYNPNMGQQVFGNTSDEFLKGLELYDMDGIIAPSQVIGPMTEMHMGVMPPNGAQLQELGFFGLL